METLKEPYNAKVIPTYCTKTAIVVFIFLYLQAEN